MTTSVVEISCLGGSPRRKMSRVNARAPFRWVRQGVDDFRRAPVLSTLYGAVFCALAYGAVSRSEATPEATFGYLAALVFVGPFLAAGLYAVRRELERNKPPKLGSGFRPLARRWSYIALYSLALAALVVGCVQIAGLSFAVYESVFSIPPDSLSSLFSSPVSWLMLGAVTGLVLLLAWVVFVVSAVSVPLVFDGDADLVTSMISSYQVVSLNRVPMLLWFSIVVLLMVVGVAAWFIGLILVFPVLGYATWHSYRDLLRRPLENPQVAEDMVL